MPAVSSPAIAAAGLDKGDRRVGRVDQQGALNVGARRADDGQVRGAEAAKFGVVKVELSGGDGFVKYRHETRGRRRETVDHQRGLGSSRSTSPSTFGLVLLVTAGPQRQNRH